MADTQSNPLDRIDPSLALRQGEFDAQAVLLLWCIRKAFYPMLWLGFGVAFIAYGNVESLGQELEGFDSPEALLGNLLSPLGVLVLAFMIRVLVNWVALGAAYPLTLSTQHTDYVKGNRLARGFHLWWDRLYQARAYRALRLTWAVRQEAYARLDLSAGFYRICEFVINWANVVLLIALFVVIGVVAGNSG